MKEIWEFLAPTEYKGKPIKTKYHKALDEKLKDIENDIVILVPTKMKWSTKNTDYIPIRIITNSKIDKLFEVITEHYDTTVTIYKVSSKVFS